ncbi:sinapine esterase-like [Typha angustifolia]|uniref:sinapine esterase-like n=1 Tax=Typha angustifolia TaxID=59011 RepID=UPI003C2E2A3E
MTDKDEELSVLLKEGKMEELIPLLEENTIPSINPKLCLVGKLITDCSCMLLESKQRSRKPGTPIVSSMTSSNGSHLLLLSLLLLSTSTALCCYTHIFNFGDSIDDNGNWLHYAPDPGPVSQLPYGQTFFGYPTGRFSNGRIIVDFIADAMKMPFLTPYLAGKTAQDFRYGANFAVGGATALNQDFFREKGLSVEFTPYSLETQIKWFKKVLNLLGSKEADRREIMSNSLFLVGEIGGNDYNQPFFQGRTIEEI